MHNRAIIRMELTGTDTFINGMPGGIKLALAALQGFNGVRWIAFLCRFADGFYGCGIPGLLGPEKASRRMLGNRFLIRQTRTAARGKDEHRGHTGNQCKFWHVNFTSVGPIVYLK